MKPFHSVIEKGFSCEVSISEEGDVIIRIPFGNAKQAEKMTERLRGRHKYE